MTAVIQYILYLVILVALAVPLGAYIKKVMNGEITDVKEDIGTLTISTNTPTVEAGSVLVFKNTNKDKVGIIWVKAVTLGEKKDLNTISMDVYYEK